MKHVACTACGFVHTSRDARAIGRFSGTPLTFTAANAGTPPRATRDEAEADECAWRQQRTATRQPLERATEDAPLFTIAPEAAVVEAPEFPGAAMETAARAKAWRDFLAEAHMSLLVWQVDEAMRADCEHVFTWLRRCRDDLVQLVPA